MSSERNSTERKSTQCQFCSCKKQRTPEERPKGKPKEYKLFRHKHAENEFGYDDFEEAFYTLEDAQNYAQKIVDEEGPGHDFLFQIVKDDKIILDSTFALEEDSLNETTKLEWD